MNYKYPVLRKFDILHEGGFYYHEENKPVHIEFDDIKTVKEKVSKNLDIITKICVKRIKGEKRSVRLFCCGVGKVLHFKDRDMEDVDIFMFSYPVIFKSRIRLSYEKEQDKDFSGYQVAVEGISLHKSKLYELDKIAKEALYIDFCPDNQYLFVSGGTTGFRTLHDNVPWVLVESSEW